MPEGGYLLVETCGLHCTLRNKNSCADVQINITIWYKSRNKYLVTVNKKEFAYQLLCVD